MRTFLFAGAAVLGLIAFPQSKAYSDTAVSLTTLPPGGW